MQIPLSDSILHIWLGCRFDASGSWEEKMMCHCHYVLWLLEKATPVDTYSLPSVFMGIMEIWVDHANNSLRLHCFACLQVPEYQPSTCPWGDGVCVSVSLINCWQMSRTCLSPQLSVHSPSVSNEPSCQCLNVLSCFMYMYECFLCCNLDIAFQFCARTGVIHCLYVCHKSDLQKLYRQLCAS